MTPQSERPWRRQPARLTWLAPTLTAALLAACSNPATPTPATTHAAAPTAATYSLTGTVTDQNGNLLLHDTVWLTQSVNNAYTQVASAFAVNGSYTFTGLASGSYLLSAASAGCCESSSFTPVSLTGNQTVTVVITAPLVVQLSGHVFSADTSMPLAGVEVDPTGQARPSLTDGSGAYSATAGLEFGPLPSGTNQVWAQLAGYDSSDFYIRSATQDFYLHSVRTFTMGTSAQVTVLPTDSLPNNNTVDPTEGVAPYVCRLIHTTAPTAGVVTIESVSASGAHYPLTAQSTSNSCCGLGNPQQFLAAAGEDITIWVESPANGPAETFTVTASMASGSAAPAGWQMLAPRPSPRLSATRPVAGAPVRNPH